MSPKAYGGRKTRDIKIIRGGTLGANPGETAEGIVYSSKIKVVNKNGKSREIEIAEKEFYDPKHKNFRPKVFRENNKPNMQRPLKQWKIYNELKELKIREKLDLPLVPTMRIVRSENGIPRLILTKFNNEVRLANLTNEEIKYVNKETNRIEELLNSKGYNIEGDSFLIERDLKTRKIKVWIVDFGNITKKKIGPTPKTKNITSWFKYAKKRVKR